MKKLSILSFGLLFLLFLPARGSEWRDVAPGDRVSLPADLYFEKDYRIQWWYFTGHVFDPNGKEFGYEVTFFAAGIQKRKYRSKFGVDTVYFAHIAVTDVEGKRYYHFSVPDAGAYGFAGADDERLHVWVDKDFVEGTPRKMHIKASAADVALDLVLTPLTPAVLNGERGYSRKSEASPLIASRYFSLPYLGTEGTMSVGSSVFPVTGKSWFDREISSRGLSKEEAGWDWFSIQFEDGRELMLYNVRNKDGAPGAYSSGTFVERDGRYRRLAKDDFTVTVLARYTSKHTGARYPAKWEVSVPLKNLKLLVTPLLQDQEFTVSDALGKSYWEGTCGVEGSAWGRAYVEMTGY